jgi:hypothetical protein
MDITDLLIESLAMQDVKIEKQKCCRKTRKLELWIRQNREDACCYQCGGPLYGVHSWRQKVLKGPPVGAFNHVMIYLFQLQAACDMCQKVRLAHAPYLHPGFKKSYSLELWATSYTPNSTQSMQCSLVQTLTLKLLLRRLRQSILLAMGEK